jgi:hypothetical protein
LITGISFYKHDIHRVMQKTALVFYDKIKVITVINNCV